MCTQGWVLAVLNLLLLLGHFNIRGEYSVLLGSNAETSQRLYKLLCKNASRFNEMQLFNRFFEHSCKIVVIKSFIHFHVYSRA